MKADILDAQAIARRLGTFLYFPLLLLLLPFIALGVAVIFFNATVLGLFQRRRWLGRLRKNGRVIATAELLATTHEGTLIVDRPGFNFKEAHCWWTMEDATELSPVAIPTDDERVKLSPRTNELTPHEFDRWCWRRYISPVSGSAMLVAPVRNGDATASMLRERLPNLAVVMSWSALAAMEADPENEAEQ